MAPKYLYHVFWRWHPVTDLVCTNTTPLVKLLITGPNSLDDSEVITGDELKILHEAPTYVIYQTSQSNGVRTKKIQVFDLQLPDSKHIKLRSLWNHHDLTLQILSRKNPGLGIKMRGCDAGTHKVKRVEEYLQ
jgi:hypothetical protein